MVLIVGFTSPTYPIKLIPFIVDWEHPSTTTQGQHFLTLVSSLRSALPSHSILTTAVPAGQWALTHIPLAQISHHLTYINLMCYDFSGPWTHRCGHASQLHTHTKPHDDAAKLSGESAVAYVLSHGVPASKIVMGIPCYGRSFLDAKKPGDEYYGHAGEEGTFEYRDLPRTGAKVVWDEKCGASYCVGGDAGFVSYDDQRAVKAKAEFVKEQGLQGLFYWTGTGDTNDERSLVKAGFEALHKR